MISAAARSCVSSPRHPCAGLFSHKRRAVVLFGAHTRPRSSARPLPNSPHHKMQYETIHVYRVLFHSRWSRGCRTDGASHQRDRQPHHQRRSRGSAKFSCAQRSRGAARRRIGRPRTSASARRWHVGVRRGRKCLPLTRRPVRQWRDAASRLVVFSEHALSRFGRSRTAKGGRKDDSRQTAIARQSRVTVRIPTTRSCSKISSSVPAVS